MLSFDKGPSFRPDSEFMITDTYPVIKNEQRLIVYILKQKSIVLGSFNTYYTGSLACCGLYTKTSKEAKLLSDDTVHNPKHFMIIFKINWNNINKSIS